MTYDLSVYWVEDTVSWCSSAKKLLDNRLRNDGISVNFICEDNVTNAIAQIQNSCTGFKKYDLFFIDYNISSEIMNGKDIIDSLRKSNVDVDILFYSENKKKKYEKSSQKIYRPMREYMYLTELDLKKRLMLSLKKIRGKCCQCKILEEG